MAYIAAQALPNRLIKRSEQLLKKQNPSERRECNHEKEKTAKVRTTTNSWKKTGRKRKYRKGGERYER